MKKRQKTRPSVVVSLIPVVLLVGLLSYCITIFGDGMLSGPSQLVLMLCTGVAVFISLVFYGLTWQELENAMVISISVEGCLSPRLLSTENEIHPQGGQMTKDSV